MMKYNTYLVDHLRQELNLGEYGDKMADFRACGAYIEDSIPEAAEESVDVYFSDLKAWAGEHFDALAEVVDEGLYSPEKYDFFDHIRAAQAMYAENDIRANLLDALALEALDFIQYDLRRNEITGDAWVQIVRICSQLSEDCIGTTHRDLANAVRGIVETMDNPKTVEDIKSDPRLVFSHTSTAKGYVSRRVSGLVEEYKGRFGEGFKVYRPRWDSTTFCYVDYYIYK